MGRSQAMRIGKFILRTVLFLLLAAVAGAGLYLYPAWKAAKALGDEMERPCKAFVLEVELDRDAVPREQEKMLGMLAKLTGIPEDAMCRLSIEGSAMEGKVHLLICPDGRTEPLREFYLSDDMSVINETMLYSAIRGNLTEKLGLLDYLMPRQEETLYMTLEQVEQLFGADLSGIGDMRLPVPEKEIGAGEYFLLLAVMAREKSGNGYSFALEREQMSLGFDVADGGGAMMRLQIQDPAQALARAGRLLPWLEKALPKAGKLREGMQGVKSLSVTLTPQEGGSLTIPTNLASQDTINVLSNIRTWVQETFGGFGG